MRKIVNAGDLLWGSFDEGERMVVVYAAAWAALLVMFALRHRQRESLKAELLAELHGARA